MLYSSLTSNYQNLKASGLSFKSDLIILIHDFTSNGYTGWIKASIRNNIILVSNNTIDNTGFKVRRKMTKTIKTSLTIGNSSLFHRFFTVNILNILKTMKVSNQTRLINKH